MTKIFKQGTFYAHKAQKWRCRFIIVDSLIGRQSLMSFLKRSNYLFQRISICKVNFSDCKYVSCSPKTSNLHAKVAQIWHIALFLFLYVSTFCTFCSH